MGGGSTRKKNDAPRINLPKNDKGKGREGASTGSDGSLRDEKDINNVCPAVFRVLISIKPLVTEGSFVDIRNGQLYVGNELVGQLNKAHLQMINDCSVLGIKYRGRVIFDEQKSYARFEQI